MPCIAVIDDDPLIRDLIAEALGDGGVAVQCAPTGRAGRRLLTEKRFDLAIIDLVLPDASGIALAAIAANENTPVLLITGRPDVAARLEPYDLLELPCLLKPFDLVRLRMTTQRVMAESRQNVQRIMQGMARRHASLIALEDTMADARRLIAVRRWLCQPNETPDPN